MFPLIGGSASFCSRLQQYIRCVDCTRLLSVCGWWCASLSLANSRLVSVTGLCVLQIAPCLFCTHTRRKNWNILIFFALEWSSINISSLVLRLGCMVYFSLNAVGAPKSSVGMGGNPKNVCTDVTLCILYYFCIQEIQGLVRFFVGEFNR